MVIVPKGAQGRKCQLWEQVEKCGLGNMDSLTEFLYALGASNMYWREDYLVEMENSLTLFFEKSSFSRKGNEDDLILPWKF